MLKEVNAYRFRDYFPTDPHGFISEKFIDLNEHKVDHVIRLIDDSSGRPSLGLVAGIKDRYIKSPFSAPFGGFHFRNQLVYTSEIDQFVSFLKDYITESGLAGMEIILPPDIYHQSFNAKTINSLIRQGFTPSVPELTNWVDLTRFKGEFTQKNSREYYRQAIRNNLSFESASDYNDKVNIYDLIYRNRLKFGRPIYMTLEDIIEMDKLWAVDFFKVITADQTMVAAAIFYRYHPEIVYAVFWGDNEEGRPLRAMDFMSLNLWSYYKNMGYNYLDMGISTEFGVPNQGLLRFKETHDSTSSLRFKFNWTA